MKLDVIGFGEMGVYDVSFVSTFQRQSEAKIFVTRQFMEGKRVLSEDEEEHVIDVMTFATSPAHARVDFGLTVNLGNYNSAKIQVGAIIPCYTEELEDALAFGAELAKHFLVEERKKIKAKNG